MLLVQFNNVDGRTVYINPDQVVAVEAEKSDVLIRMSDGVTYRLGPAHLTVITAILQRINIP